jgi:hypothetical protein
MARMQRSLFAQLNALAEEISQGTVKAAAEKAAGPTPADPGGYQGASSHPTTSVDNNVQSAPEGARASEYETDIKKQQGALAVDNAPEMSPEGRQNEVQLNIGTNAKATGEDPAAEKDFKGTKDDPGTSSPAKANDGEKYSNVSFKTARDQCSTLGNDILAALINFGTGKLKKAEDDDCDDEADDDDDHEEKSDSGKLKGDQHKLDVDNDGKIEGADLAALRSGDKKEAAFKAGYELAAKFGLDKQAAEASVREVCANTIREADEMADLILGFVTSKSAAADPAEEAAEGEDHSAPGDEGSGAAPAGLEAMLGGGEGMPAEAGMEAGMEGAAMGGEPSEEEAVQELAMALEELGIPPEALLEALAGGGGGAGAGADPAAMAAMGGGGGADPAAMAAMAGEPKMAKARELRDIGTAVLNFKRAGRFQVKEARTKRSRQLRDIMKQHVIELVSR